MEEKSDISKKSLIAFLKKNKGQLQQFNVSSIGIFGSYSRDEANKQSDIDLLVEFESGRKTFDNLIGLNDFLEHAHNKQVDLVTKASISKYIWPYIEKDVEYVQVIP